MAGGPGRGIPIPGGVTVTEARERFEVAMQEVRKQTNRLGEALRDLEIYARERSGEVRGHCVSTEASKAYDDMADRIAALRGPVL